MNQEKRLGLQSQCPFFHKMLGTAVPGPSWAISTKNVKREMGQICNISFSPFLTIKLGKKRPKWQNLRRHIYIYIHTHIYIYIYADAVGLICWPSFGHFNVKMLAKITLKCWPRSFRAVRIGVWSDFFRFFCFFRSVFRSILGPFWGVYSFHDRCCCCCCCWKFCISGVCPIKTWCILRFFDYFLSPPPFPKGVQKWPRSFVYTLEMGVFEILASSAWSPETTTQIGVLGRHRNSGVCTLLFLWCFLKTIIFRNKKSSSRGRWQTDGEEEEEEEEEEKQEKWEHQQCNKERRNGPLMMTRKRRKIFSQTWRRQEKEREKKGGHKTEKKKLQMNKKGLRRVEEQKAEDRKTLCTHLHTYIYHKKEKFKKHKKTNQNKKSSMLITRLKSEKVFASQESVSGFPEKGADLRGSPGNFWGSPGKFRGSLGNFRGTPGLLLGCTVREPLGKSPKNFRGSLGNFRGSPGTFEKLGVARLTPSDSPNLSPIK